MSEDNETKEAGMGSHKMITTLPCGQTLPFCLVKKTANEC